MKVGVGSRGGMNCKRGGRVIQRDRERGRTNNTQGCLKKKSR